MTRTQWRVAACAAFFAGVAFHAAAFATNSSGTVSTTLHGTEPGALFGYTLAVGDVTGDHVDDLIVGSINPGVSAGSVSVYDGTDLHLVTVIHGQAGETSFGQAIAVADFDGDGISEIVASDPTANQNRGAVRIYHGGDFTVVRSFSGAVNSFFGWSLAAADLNHNGHQDLLIGATEAFNAASGPGYVNIYSGSRFRLVRTLHGEHSLDSFGYSLITRDLNHDGYPEVVVGAPGYGEQTLDGKGAAYLFAGRTLNLRHRWEGSQYNQNLGGSLAAAADLDGDGFDDLALGAPAGNYVSIVSARRGTNLRTLTPGDGSPALFGYAVTPLDDQNGDGASDFAVGDPCFAPTTPYDCNGRVQVFSGADGSVIRESQGQNPNDFYGAAVVSFGGKSVYATAVSAPLQDGTGVIEVSLRDDSGTGIAIPLGKVSGGVIQASGM